MPTPSPHAARPIDPFRGILPAFGVFACFLALYLMGLAPGLLWGDSAEMQILAGIGGVAHPTGYPLFTLVGRAFTAIPLGDEAWRANLVSAWFAAATIGLLVWVLIRRGTAPLAAIAGASAWGLSFTFWSTAQRSEVYSLATFVAVAALAATLEALGNGRRTMRFAAGFLLGLTLTGHLAFAPMVAVAGLALAWPLLKRGPLGYVEAMALFGVFAVGLTPYAYLIWADVSGHGLNYLQLVELVQWPLGPVPEEFRGVLDRFRWLITSQNEYPPLPFHYGLRRFAKNISDAGFLLAMFEFGPVAAALALWGAWRRSSRDRSRTLLLLGMGVATLVFALLFSGFKILAVFMIPGYLLFAMFIAYGLEELLPQVAPTLPFVRRAALLVLLMAAGLFAANAVRLVAYDRPLGPFRSQVLEEDDMPQRRLFPSMHDVTEPRRFVEASAQSLPDSALVICAWREFMALLYLQRVEHRRTDLSVHPVGYPKLLTRVEDWQQRYDLTHRPVVIVSPLEMLQPHLVSSTPLVLATGQKVLVSRTPLRISLGEGSVSRP